MAQEIKLPNLGEEIEGGDVVRVLVAPGDAVTAEQTVAEVETDKAVLEVPCPVAGKVTEVKIKAGDHISVGDVLLLVEAGAGAEEPEKAAAPAEAPAKEAPAKEAPAKEAPAQEAPAPAEVEEPPVAAEPAPAVEEPVPAGPGTRRLARELGVDLAAVAAAHPGDRLTEEHIRSFAEKPQAGTAAVQPVAPPTTELPDFSKWGPVERQPFSTLQQKTAAHLHTGWIQAPHVTQFDEADITDLEALRRHYRETEVGKKVRLTVTAFIVKALAEVLREFPQFNASLDTARNELVLKRYYHIGVAVDTPAGLIVPVLRDVDTKSVIEIATEMDELAERTRQRKIGLDELRGGTFTVTNLGGIGGTAFTPIINYPEVAILGVARSRQVAVLKEDELQNRLMMPLCLSYDHRVINGADGARFIVRLRTLLEDPPMLLLES